MTTNEEILHYIGETMKLYPTLNFISVLSILQINESSIHNNSSNEWILSRVKSIYKIIKKDYDERQISKNN